jgi:DNA polymerase-3 subunit epsilon
LELFNKKKLNQLNFIEEQIKSNPSKENSTNQNKKIEKILILDTETSGLDENINEVIEIGCILFDVSFKCVLSQVSFLFPVNNNEAEYVNGISAEVSNISQPWEDGLNFFLKLVDCSDFIVAHNVEFDKKWFGKGRLPKLNKKWICTLEDINWSFKKSLKIRPSVTDLALSFSIPVWSLHRALSDCYYISEVFKKCDNLEEILLKATEPRFLYKALVNYEERSLAKNAGFRWNSPVQGAWSKKLTSDEAKNLDFSVEILN